MFFEFEDKSNGATGLAQRPDLNIFPQQGGWDDSMKKNIAVAFKEAVLIVKAGLDAINGVSKKAYTKGQQERNEFTSSLLKRMFGPDILDNKQRLKEIKGMEVQTRSDSTRASVLG